MFADPIPAPPDASVFNWVWTYNVKTDEAQTKRPVASVTVLLVVAKFVAPSRTSASTVPMSVMPSQKLLPLRRLSTCGSTVSFNIGGLHTSDAPRYRMDTSYLFNEPFKVTPNPLT
jgi:hypothetical protein